MPSRIASGRTRATTGACGATAVRGSTWAFIAGLHSSLGSPILLQSTRILRRACRVHPPPHLVRRGATLTAHLPARLEAGRRSWHLSELVGLGGCPGVEGPYPSAGLDEWRKV